MTEFMVTRLEVTLPDGVRQAVECPHPVEVSLALAALGRTIRPPNADARIQALLDEAGLA